MAAQSATAGAQPNLNNQIKLNLNEVHLFLGPHIKTYHETPYKSS